MWQLIKQLAAEGSAGSKDREDALRQILALTPDDPWALNDQAQELLDQHRAKEALPLALRAVKFRPGNPDILDTLARAFFENGRCDDALRLELRVQGLLAQFDPDSRFPELRERIERYQKCAKSPQAP
ncbi:MAG: hypothetical protein ABW133_23325 [Polyangiaceae bacterium]